MTLEEFTAKHPGAQIDVGLVALHYSLGGGRSTHARYDLSLNDGSPAARKAIVDRAVAELDVLVDAALAEKA